MSKTSLPKHEFTVRTVGVSVMDDSVFDALFEAGCDDALVGTNPDGDFLDFVRAAPTLDDAVASARAAVESVPGLRVLRVELDSQQNEALGAVGQTS